MAQNRDKAFTLVEAVAATAIIGIIASSILVVFIRCSSAVRDSTRQVQALEVARENMEALLGAETVSEQVVYGYSDKYPAIQWTNKVETFYEPVAEKMWLRAVCSAQYEDSSGELKTVELTHWLTKLNEKQVQQILDTHELLETKAAQLGFSGRQEMMSDRARPDGTPVDGLPQLPKNLTEMTPEEIEQWLDQIKNK